ncbi:phage portal protein [Hymenobacter sp. ASUV-10]|uniref:Phage portal protein n=1 Tax=Hymenobacter aranciens TaxID=3063996 RepID=A0ABT9BCA1_9BACT|nr:phage portal protein [Hymenobacter sp. ASUV-10]MDO7874331.1 phage portal protein [Hymenobacter sp. ASUV-10]
MANQRNRKRLETPSVTKNTPHIARVELASVKLPTVSTSRVQSQSQQWVKYGEKNDFPQYLIDAEGKCAPHAAFLGLRRNLIAGEGLAFSDNIQAALEAINDEGTADDLLEDVAGDLSVFETFACQVVYTRNKSAIVNVYHVPSANVRPHKQLDDRGNPIGYWVSADWSNTTNCQPKFYERFDPLNIGTHVKQVDASQAAPAGSQLYFYHKRALDQPYLPQVSYRAALTYVELAREMGVFSLSSIVNGFSSPGIMNVASTMDDEAKRDLVYKFNQTMTGAENASKVLLTVSDIDTITWTGTGTEDITPRIEAYNRIIVEQVSSAHRGNPMLAGIQSEGASLGGDANTYATSLDVYHNTVINPLQRPFLRFLNRVLTFNGATEFELDIARLGLVNAAMSDDMKFKLLKPEVIASEFGYKPEDLVAAPIVAEAIPAPAAPVV